MVDEGDNHWTQVDGDVPVHEPNVDQRLPMGTEIEGYVVDGVVGKGGMGVVYSATHAVIGKRCAVKVLRAEVSTSPVAVERFIQEARAVNLIGHPNIIDIFDFGTLPDGRAYHLMDLLVGESLRKRLRRGPLHPSEAAAVIEGVSSALIAAHDKGFVHRDLKPDNVYLIANDHGGWPEVKLLDFGLAKLMPEAGHAAFITKTGVMLGTPEYMSPEQARGVSVDHRTDIYALGILMFEILSGRRPFPSTGDAFALLQYHAEEPPPSLAAHVAELPPEMVQLVDAMLSKEPGARPSLAAVRTVIKRLRTTKLPTASVAGRELATFSSPGIRPPDLSASAVGAAPLIDEDERVTTARAAVAAPDHAPDHAPESVPPLPSVPSVDAGAPRFIPATPPGPNSAGYGVGSPQPPAPAPDRRTSAPKFIPATTPNPSGHGTPRFVPASTAPGTSSGLAGAANPHASTTLGVPPPPRMAPSARQAAVAPSSRRLWLIVGALLAIAAGIGLAVVLVG